jgi:hypothetical protein
MNVATRSATVGVMLIGGAVFAVIASIATGSVHRQGFEAGFIVPLLPPATTVLLLIVVTRAHPRGVLGGALVGATVGSALYLIVPVFYLIENYSLIKNDGTAFWGLLIVPAVWFWPAAVLAGVPLGVATYAVLRAVGKRQIRREASRR